MADETIPILLNKVWAAFRRAGITEDLRIIEYVAGFLLEQEGIPLTADLPRRPSLSSEFNETEARDWLRSAVEQTDTAAALFDRYVMFRLPEMLAGGRYPTPRHIVQMMVRLGETDGEPVADFACGSGGLLAHSTGSTLTGIEISPEWSRLARANALLHGKAADVREGNALRAVQDCETFARILMNPPFGESVSSGYGTRSETALGILALAHLSEGGRAALLAPTGLLFSGSQHEHNLRKKLVDDHHLEAVVSLPEDAFQPYSALRTHLLLAHKVPPAEGALTWFLRPVFDGYIAGRGRDLTSSPQTPNDLMLVEKAVLASRQAGQPAEGVPLTVQFLEEGEQLLGALLRPVNGAILVSVCDLPATRTADQEEPVLLIVEVEREGQRQSWQCPLKAGSVPQDLPDVDGLIRQRLGLKKSDALPPRQYQNQSALGGQGLSLESASGRGVLVKCLPDEKTQLMGVAVARATLRTIDYALEPDRYVREPEVSAKQRSPHDILRDIAGRQQELAQKMSQLAGWLVPERRQEESLLSPILEATPFGKLDTVQRGIWEAVSRMTEPISDKPDDRTDSPFVPESIEGVGKFSEEAVRQALGIFEAMGLIVPVTLKHPQTAEPMAYYRRTEDKDVWKRTIEEGSE